MNDVKRYHVTEAGLVEGVALGRITVVLVADFDRVTAERNALQLLLNDRDEQTHNLEQSRRAEFDNGQAAESQLAALREELATAKRNEHNSEVAYKAAIEKQKELRADLARMTDGRDGLRSALDEANKIIAWQRDEKPDLARLADAERRNVLVMPSNQEVSLLVWDVHLKMQSIPGISVFNAAEISAAALMEKIKELNQ